MTVKTFFAIIAVLALVHGIGFVLKRIPVILKHSLHA